MPPSGDPPGRIAARCASISSATTRAMSSPLSGRNAKTLVDPRQHLRRELGVGEGRLRQPVLFFRGLAGLIGDLADAPRGGVGGENEDRFVGRDAGAVADLGDEAVVPRRQEALVDFRMRLLELVQQHDRVRHVAQRRRHRAVAVRADIAAGLAEQACRRVRLAELAHVEEVQMAACPP